LFAPNLPSYADFVNNFFEIFLAFSEDFRSTSR